MAIPKMASTVGDLDVANEVPSGFWKDWNNLVRELNPEAYTVGEFWGDARQACSWMAGFRPR